MASGNVQAESASATAKLSQELERLEAPVRRMETLLSRAGRILSTIRFDSSVCCTPTKDEDVTGHRRALDMIEFLCEQITNWRNDERGNDFVADDIKVIAHQLGNLASEPA